MVSRPVVSSQYVPSGAERVHDGQLAPIQAERQKTLPQVQPHPLRRVELRPGHDDAFALVLPEAKAVIMDLFLVQFSETLPTGVHAVLVLDQADWHGQAALQVANVTLLPYSPELNQVERVWLYLRERLLSFRLYRSE